MRKRVFWQMRRVYTQANAAGGAVVVDVSPGEGQALKIVALNAVNSGTNSLGIRVVDEDNANGALLDTAASAAAVALCLPKCAGTAGAGQLAASVDMAIPYTSKLSIYQAGAGAQNDTLTIALTLELLGSTGAPTTSKARSTNQADVTEGANTIAAPYTVVEDFE